MKLVLAEKPSVAQSLAKVLGANKRCDGYLEGNGYVVSWCVGHLVELSQPEAYNETYAKWRLEDLPILPTAWKYQVSASTKKQFGILKDLMKREDVKSLVCATDAGREGELIFRLVYHQADCRKPFERLWISSMEDQAIRDGFAHLEPSTKYDALYEAALCRERADWIVGMNATRLFSCLYHQTLNVGRVMTPTLAMVVMRDAEIAAFVSKPFYTVQLGMDGITAASRRFDDKEDAQEVLAKCKESMKAVVKSMDRKEKTEHAPLLYDLTSLQRDANRILGFTAQQTLNYTQALYEKKLVTYPRTDSRYLTEDMKPMLPALITQVAEKIGADASAWKADNGTELSVDGMCDSRKVSDHHAIIPTGTMCAADLTALPSGEKAILQLIAVRLLCAAAPNHRYAEDMIVLVCGGEDFTKKVRTVLYGGWKDIWQHFYPSKEKEQEPYGGPILYPNAMVPFSQAEIKEGKTTAPKHFTEDSLLSAMERAGADEMPDEVERKGIGTSATRAATIEKLVRIGFVERKGNKKTKYLLPTHKGVALITVMPEQIQSPSMTAEWEQKLLDVEKGAFRDAEFMNEIEGMITELVRTYKIIEDAEALMHPVLEEIGTCPCCGRHVVERQKGYSCENRQCNFVLWKQNRFFEALGKKMTKPVAIKLLSDGKVALKGCKSKKTGKTYDTTVIMTVDEKQRAVFELNFEKGADKYGKSKNKKD